MIKNNQKLYAYPFKGYWRDVGTIESFWEANMDLLSEEPGLDLYNPNWRVYSVNATRPPHYIGPNAKVSRSLISEGCSILGEVDHSVIFPGVHIAEGTCIRDSIVMPYVNIGAFAQVYRAIIGRKSSVEVGVIIGNVNTKEITVIDENIVIASEIDVLMGSIIDVQKQVG